MPAGNTVWGIEIGQCALKAVKLRQADEGKLELLAFDLIEHPKILSQPDAEPDELIRAALEKFVSRNDWQRDPFVIGVPGQQTFARFCKLPPVDAKKIPDIVRFEASQQIPFDMDDVVWDYEVFQEKDSPDVEVGIFAMRRDLIRRQIGFYSDFGVSPIGVQTIPCALYNFCRFELPQQEGGATVIIDVGAQNTDLVIVEPNSAWTRNIPLGGNNFTEALIKAFKLSFAKAESLKKTAATSKYARQIFQAMRPVFAELVAEVQRSLGFYASTHREIELVRVLACGNAFRLPGLQKYLENNLTVGGGVMKLEKFETLIPTPTSNAPQFTENILGFAPAFGLAVQGLGMAKISANLLPPELARIALWKRKRPYFVAAAACLGLAAVFPWTRGMLDKAALAANSDSGDKARAIITEAGGFVSEYNRVKTDTGEARQKVEEFLKIQSQTSLIPRLLAVIHQALPTPDAAIAQVKDGDELKKLVTSDPRRTRIARKQMLIDALEVKYDHDIEKLDGSTVAASEGDSSSGANSARGGGDEDMPFMGKGGGKGGMMGGGGFTPGGGGGGGGGGGESSESSSESEGAGGFYVVLRGRLLFGRTSSEALTVIYDDFANGLKRFGQLPGLGFHVMDSDPKVPSGGKYNVTLRYIRQASQSAQQNVSARAGMQVGGATETEANRDLDPVTGEDRSTDWLFELGFKIKLGDYVKPEAPAGEEGASGDQNKDNGSSPSQAEERP